jgi:hypothetical protein
MFAAQPKPQPRPAAKTFLLASIMPLARRLPGCAVPGQPLKYPPILAADYLKAWLVAAYGAG